MSSGCPYGECDGTGFVVDEATNTARPCSCRPQRLAMRKAQALSAVIPKRYRSVGWDRAPLVDMDQTVVGIVRRFAAQIDAHLDEGDGLRLMGDHGTGKTTLAMLVSKAAMEAGRSVAIYSLPRLLSELRRSFDADADRSHVELLDRLADVDLLHLDDLGAQNTSQWVLEELYSIVNARYEDQRSIIVTTNISEVEELSKQIGPRTVSRLSEMCLDVPLFGHDRRTERFSAA